MTDRIKKWDGLKVGDSCVVKFWARNPKFQVGVVTKVSKLYYWVKVGDEQYTFLKRNLKERGTYEYARSYNHIVVVHPEGYSGPAYFAGEADAIAANEKDAANKRRQALVLKLKRYDFNKLDAESLEQINAIIDKEE